MPFAALPRPALNDLAGNLMRAAEGSEAPRPASSRPE
jgi:hypothetical protein